jgi:hypothetical protein
MLSYAQCHCPDIVRNKGHLNPKVDGFQESLAIDSKRIIIGAQS